MATLADSLISSTSRSLTLRMRPDLQARRQRYHGLTFWVVKEPINLSYYRFHEEEYAILCMLDGRTSLQDIKDEFETNSHRKKSRFRTCCNSWGCSTAAVWSSANPPAKGGS